MDEQCPKCGYCPACGRQNPPDPIYPVFPWWTPPVYTPHEITYTPTTTTAPPKAALPLETHA